MCYEVPQDADRLTVKRVLGTGAALVAIGAAIHTFGMPVVYLMAGAVGVYVARLVMK